MKIVLVGAGSAQFGLGTLGDIFCSKSLAGSEITLLDINPHTVEEVRQKAQLFIEKHALKFTITATTDRKIAFKGAQFIISSIEIGDRFKLWDEDWKIPQQYGVHQVYGENGGPGGIFHALRIVPVVLDIVKDAMEICPDAYIFNYSNPMTAICTTVKRAFPQAKFIGMCHEIGWLNRWLPPMLGKKSDEIFYRAAGLNHFSCMIEIKDKKSGKDLYPEVLQKAPNFFLHDSGYSDMWDEVKKTGKISDSEKFHKSDKQITGNYLWADKHINKFILENYNLLPITVDSHFGEYLSWAWDIADHRGIMDFYDLYKVMLSQENKHEIKLETSERVIPIIDGILTDGNFEEAAVNILNTGIINDLPSWIAVECPATINKNGITGIKMPNLSKGYLSLLRSYCSVYDLTAEAVIQKKKSLVVQAMLANPVVHQASKITDMVDRMISQQGKWLSYLK